MRHLENTGLFILSGFFFLFLENWIIFLYAPFSCACVCAVPVILHSQKGFTWFCVPLL
ncbi:MAG: hypothetical protein ACLSTK_01540 [Mediterraneibacter gnavus]